jgi:hypothetical protein
LHLFFQEAKQETKLSFEDRVRAQVQLGNEEPRTSAGCLIANTMARAIASGGSAELSILVPKLDLGTHAIYEAELLLPPVIAFEQLYRSGQPLVRG